MTVNHYAERKRNADWAAAQEHFTPVWQTVGPPLQKCKECKALTESDSEAMTGHLKYHEEQNKIAKEVARLIDYHMRNTA